MLRARVRALRGAHVAISSFFDRRVLSSHLSRLPISTLSPAQQGVRCCLLHCFLLCPHFHVARSPDSDHWFAFEALPVTMHRCRPPLAIHLRVP